MRALLKRSVGRQSKNGETKMKKKPKKEAEGEGPVEVLSITGHRRQRTEFVERDREQSGILDRNPNPVFCIDTGGKVRYKNAAARHLTESLAPEERGLQLYRLAVLVRKVVKNETPQKTQYHINGADFRVEALPRRDEDAADLYFTEISESVKIKNYFEVQAAFAAALLEAETVEDVVWSIVKQAVARLGYEDCVVYLLGDDGETLEQKAAHGPKNPRETDVKDPIILEIGQGITGSVALSKKGEIVNDTSKDPRYIVDDEVRLSEITVPILDDDKVIGIIDSEHRSKDFYSAEDLSILTAIASMAATKIQRLKTTESIKASRAKTESLINNAFGGIYILRNHRFEMVNTVFRNITGYSEQELLSDAFEMNRLIYQVEESGLKAMREREAGDRRPKSYRITLMTKHSEIRRLAINTVILEDERGPYTLGIALDITQLIESERTLRELNAELSERNEELKQFAQLASHNLRAPVSNMIGLLGIYEQGSDPNPVNKTVIESLSKATSDLSVTLEEMHSVLRMRAEESQKFGTVDLNEILEKTCVVLKNEIDSAKMKICVDFEIEELNYVRCHIENFFFNLLSNAAKYRSRERLPELNIASRRMKNTAILTFADNGIGIDLERHGKDIFGMYKRFHNHPDSRGIGLYLVHAQLKSLDGSIEVESTPGEGTTFTLKLKLPES